MEKLQKVKLVESGEKQLVNKRKGFNWKLPIFGAIGFGIGFTIFGSINTTIINYSSYGFPVTYPDMNLIMDTMIKGFIIGSIGGATLGLGYEDLFDVFIFSILGAFGFSISFGVLFMVDPNTIPDLGRFIIRLLGGPEYLSLCETGLAFGLGEGTIIGGIGGLLLGLASPKWRMISSPILCILGAVWFANAFAFGNAIFEGRFVSSWDFIGGAIGGGIFGFTLAIILLIYNIVNKQKGMPE